MKKIALILLLSLPLSPAMAQDAPADDGFSLMEEGAKLLFRGLMSEMEPALDEMGKALSGMEPALKDLQPKMMELLALIDDLQNYQAPERLENGDILIRRKTDAPAPPPLPDMGKPALENPTGEVDL
jgi:hypothetical protein